MERFGKSEDEILNWDASILQKLNIESIELARIARERADNNPDV